MSLSWKRTSAYTYADLDLHLFLPPRLAKREGRFNPVSGDVCYQRKQNHHFELDVDMCAGNTECPHKPVENIVFPSPSLSKRKRRRKRVVPGKYSIIVSNFGYHGRNGQVGGTGPAIPFDVLLSLNGKKTLISGLCIKPNTQGRDSAIRVAHFVVRSDGSVNKMKRHNPMGDICGNVRLLNSREKKRNKRIGSGRKKRRKRRVRLDQEL